MSLRPDQLDRYLARIGFDRPIEHTVATLEGLQRAHMTAVPFENLHVFHRRGVYTSIDWSVPKIIDSGRGGWCFELNGAFSSLLEGLGFAVTRLAADVLLDGERPDGPDHLTLRVDLDEPYLVDVGFGDSFIRPLRLDDSAIQDGGTGPYRLVPVGTHRVLEMEEAGTWQRCFRFEPTPHLLDDFAGRSDFMQTEPGLRWTEAPFATRLLEGGPDRVWLLRDRLKLRQNGEITVTDVADDEWPATLHKWFGMTP